MAELDHEATVIRLNGGDDLQVATFEQAFGEHSNFRGKGRARRQKRRMERINNRVQRKTARKVGRQTTRTAKMMAKQDRKNIRLDNRLNRKAMKKAANEPDELPEDELSSQEMAGEDTTGTSDDASYGQSSPRTNPYMTNDSEENTPSSPDDSSEEESEEEEQEMGGEEGYDDESSFVGDDANSEFISSEAAGGQRVNPHLKDLMRKIEWNKMEIARLQKLLSAGGNVQDIQARLDNRNKRLAELNEKLQSFSNARGGRGGGARKAVRAAKREARKEMRAERKAVRHDRRRPKTQVDSELSPEIGNNRIDVPAADTQSSEFTGGKTGIIGLDQVGEIDSPNTRLIELKSNADGGGDILASKTGKTLFFVGLAALALLALSKAGKKAGA